MKTALALLLLLSIAFPPVAKAKQSQIPEAEYDVLVALYNSTTGLHWKFRWNLPTDTPCYTLYGVHCSGGHVTRIDLCSNGLRGTIPTQLGGLSNLEWLLLGDNELTGTIPPELGTLDHLVILGLNHNQLTSTIPPDLGNLTNLQELGLNSNLLTGSVPSQLGDLTNLVNLGLCFNQLTGSIPSEIGNLSHLTGLWVDFNLLSGPLPRSLMNLPLTCFSFDYTYLCEPGDASFQSWLDSFSSYCSSRTGITCEEAYLPLMCRSA